MNRSLLFVLILLLSAVVIQGCGGGEEEKVVEKEEYLAARVDEWTLTKEFLYDFISNLPPAQKEKYDSPAGRAELAGEFMDEEFFYREGLRLDMAEIDWVKKQIDDVTRKILIDAYFKENVEAIARPSQEEMLEFYELRKDQYTTLPIARAQHIFSKDPEILIEAKRRIEEGGEKMTAMALKFSDDDFTRNDGGNLGYFNPGGYIRGVGYSETFTDTVFNMEPRKLYGPIKWEKGYSLVRVNELRPAEVRPFDDVKDEISDILTKQKIAEAKRSVSEEIRKNYDWRNYMDEHYRSIQRTPAELFEFAQNTNDPRTRIRAFEEIVEKFPDDDYSPQAMFMIGFVYIEELNDADSAQRYFATLIERYPDSDVADSARWMLDNLDEPLPEFEDIDDLNEKLSDESE